MIELKQLSKKESINDANVISINDANVLSFEKRRDKDICLFIETTCEWFRNQQNHVDVICDLDNFHALRQVLFMQDG